MGAIDEGSVWQSEAQFRLKRPCVETTVPAASVVPSTFAPSSSAGGVILEAITV